MNDKQFEQLIRGISLLAVQADFQNRIAYLAACKEPKAILGAYRDPMEAIKLARKYEGYIMSGKAVQADFDKP